MHTYLSVHHNFLKYDYISFQIVILNSDASVVHIDRSEHLLAIR